MSARRGRRSAAGPGPGPQWEPARPQATMVATWLVELLLDQVKVRP